MIHLTLANPDTILSVVSRVTEVSIDILQSKERVRHISRARFAVYYAMRIEGHSFPVIGRSVKRDHTTALSGFKKAQVLAHTDHHFHLIIQSVQRALHAKELPMPAPASLQDFINRCAGRVDDIKNTKDEGVFAKRYEEDVTILLRLIQNKNESLETLYQRSV